jgi:hypothetical protein
VIPLKPTAGLNGPSLIPLIPSQWVKRASARKHHPSWMCVMKVTFRSLALCSTMSRIERVSIAILTVFLALIAFAEVRADPIGAFWFLFPMALIFVFKWFKKAHLP